MYSAIIEEIYKGLKKEGGINLISSPLFNDEITSEKFPDDTKTPHFKFWEGGMDCKTLFTELIPGFCELIIKNSGVNKSIVFYYPPVRENSSIILMMGNIIVERVKQISDSFHLYQSYFKVL